MGEYSIDRKDILGAVIPALEALDTVTAVWEGGAAAFDRVDQWSDLDIMIAVKPGTKDAAIEAVDQALSGLGPLSVRYRLPEPAWHGHSQVFYVVEGASPFEFVDTCFMDDDTERKFLEPETHGTPLVHFDRAGFTDQKPTASEDERKRIAGRIEAMRSITQLTRTGPVKELKRRSFGHWSNCCECVTARDGSSSTRATCSTTCPRTWWSV